MKPILICLFLSLPLQAFLSEENLLAEIFDRFLKSSRFANFVSFQKLRYGCSNCRFKDLTPFSRMRSEGSRFTWGSGGEAVFAKFCVCGRNRPQPFATVRNRSQPLAVVP